MGGGGLHAFMEILYMEAIWKRQQLNSKVHESQCSIQQQLSQAT